MASRLGIEVKTVEVEQEIASKDLLEGHPEIHHYTTGVGLAGIAESNALWATHFEDLNDSSEVVLFRDPLIEAMERRFRQLLLSERRRSLKAAMKIKKFGGIQAVASGLAADFAGALYQTTFENEAALPLGVPFIASFCSHSGDHEYEKQHGLLSQWRGYGAGGGFCIVFDTRELVEMIKGELNRRYWVHGAVVDAQYAVDGVTIDQLFPDLLDCCEAVVGPYVRGEATADIPPAMFSLFVGGATRLKHQGFREEREVRIVAIPGSEDLARRVQKEHPEFIPTPIPDVQSVKGKSRTKRIVKLFDGQGTTLPIRRIIVGPSANQDERIAYARTLVGPEIEITRSATPYID